MGLVSASCCEGNDLQYIKSHDLQARLIIMEQKMKLKQKNLLMLQPTSSNFQE